MLRSIEYSMAKPQPQYEHRRRSPYERISHFQFIHYLRCTGSGSGCERFWCVCESASIHISLCVHFKINNNKINGLLLNWAKRSLLLVVVDVVVDSEPTNMSSHVGSERVRGRILKKFFCRRKQTNLQTRARTTQHTNWHVDGLSSDWRWQRHSISNSNTLQALPFLFVRLRCASVTNRFNSSAKSTMDEKISLSSSSRQKALDAPVRNEKWHDFIKTQLSTFAFRIYANGFGSPTHKCQTTTNNQLASR